MNGSRMNARILQQCRERMKPLHYKNVLHVEIPLQCTQPHGCTHTGKETKMIFFVIDYILLRNIIESGVG